MNCEKCNDKGLRPEDGTPDAAQIYCECPLGAAFAAMEDVGTSCHATDAAHEKVKEAIEAATEKLAEAHDKLLKICVSVVMAHGGAIKLHGAQLEAALLMKIQFEVKQPFLEIRVVPRDEEVKKALESRIVLATTMPPKVKS